MRTSALSSRESPARRIGVILSILFLASVGTAATITGTRASAASQVHAPVDTAPPPFSTGL